MGKKIFITLILSICFTFGIYAQQIERLTFTDMRSDGTIIGNVTVNAVFMAWTQQRTSIENGMQVLYERVHLPNDKWSDWELQGREPARFTLRQTYDVLLRQYNITPRASVRLHTQGLQAVRIMTIPDGRGSPMWWSDDGRSFNVMYEFWAIIP